MRDSKMLALGGVPLALFLGYFVLRDSPWQSSTEVHTVLEVIATFLALFVGVIALVRFYSKKTNIFLFVATAFLGTALLDGYHSVVTSTAFAGNLPSGLPSLIPWSWIASRWFLSLLLWLGWLAWKREAALGERGRLGERTIYLGAGGLTLASFVFFAFVPLPRAYYPDIVFHRPEEFVPALFFLLTLIAFIKKGDWRHDPFEYWLVLSLIVGLAGQSVFMSFSGQLFDAMFDAAHVLKNVSYALVLTGLLVDTFHLFRQAGQSAVEIRQTNEALQLEVAERKRAGAELKALTGSLEQRVAERIKDLSASRTAALNMMEDAEEARTRAEQAEGLARLSEEKYRSLIVNAPYGIYRATGDGKILLANPALVKMLGYESESELAEKGQSQDVPWMPNQNSGGLTESRGAETIRGQEVTWRRKDGSAIAVHVSGRAVRNDTGDLEYFEVMAEDVTQQRQLEAQLRQAQKMEAVGQLTGGIAHDFNNLLTVILANTDLVVSSLPSELEHLRKDLQEVQGAAGRGTTLIKKLLGFSRQEMLKLVPVNLGGLISEASAVLRRLVPEHIEIRLDAGTEATVRADPGAIEQMLLNLVTNARDAMPDGGMLTIDVAQTWLDEGYLATHPWCEPGEYVCITVGDTGVGMDQETKERIFEPFFTTKAGELGTGLGMAMIYGLVKQHGGFVHVYSEVGKGTVVKLMFPVIAKDAVRRASIALTAEELPRGQETILVVEDELGIRRAMQRALETHGYTVILAGDGEEGLEIFRARESEIHLAIADLVMPKLGGRQFYEALRREGKSVKLVFSSGYSAHDLSERNMLPTDVPFLRKPWTLSELLIQVREVLDEPSMVSQ